MPGEEPLIAASIASSEALNGKTAENDLDERQEVEVLEPSVIGVAISRRSMAHQAMHWSGAPAGSALPH